VPVLVHLRTTPPPLPLPLQASVYVMSLLFSLCQEISRVGGHAIDRYIQFQSKSESILLGCIAHGFIALYSSVVQLVSVYQYICHMVKTHFLAQTRVALPE